MSSAAPAPRATAAPAAAPTWRELNARLHPFVAARVPAADVDDVLQEVCLRVHRNITQVRDDRRFTAWLYQVARSAIADHGRARARHPLVLDARATSDDEGPAPPEPAGPDLAALLAPCLALFVAALPPPYREAVSLVELRGLTVAAAAAEAGVSVTSMKSRVRRGRARLRALVEACCAIELDARGGILAITPRACCLPTLTQ
ncbi:MAG: sigma-70 family RNA polymerase sigma factor [Kofleriaceae bacterium]